MRIDFKVEGRAGMVANLAGARRDIERAILREVRTYGTNTKVTAQISALVDSGKMRDAIRDEYSDQGRVATVGWSESEFTSDGDYFYPRGWELGWSDRPGHPMIGPAHRRHAPIMLANIGQQMRKIARQRSAR